MCTRKFLAQFEDGGREGKGERKMREKGRREQGKNKGREKKWGKG